LIQKRFWSVLSVFSIYIAVRVAVLTID